MAEHVPTKGTYYAVFGALMALLVVTVGVSYIDLGVFNAYIAFTIAIVKALLVVLFFMHVKYSSRLIWIFVAAGFFWLFIMVVFTLSDFIARY